MWQGVFAEEWDDIMHVKNWGSLDDLAGDVVNNDLVGKEEL
jgi:hypothetical protein